MPILVQLFLTFGKIGLFTFGGGYAMIAVIQSICVERKGWISEDEMMNIAVIAESTPGPIAINAATYIGLKQGGLAGAVCATLGIIAPSFAIIFAISMVLEPFLAIPLVNSAFRGIQAAVGLLIFSAGLNMVKRMKPAPLPRAIMVCAFAATLAAHLWALRVSTVALMLAAAVVSLCVFVAKGGRAQ